MRQVLREPGEALCLIGELDDLETEALPRQRAANRDEVFPELLANVSDHSVVCGRCRREERNSRRQPLDQTADAAVVGTKIVAPVGDAVRLVNDEQAHCVIHEAERSFTKTFVSEALRRDEQEIHLVRAERPFDVFPLLEVGAVDGSRLDTDSARHQQLIAHQREQRTDEQGRSRSAVAQDARRKEVDEALAPAGALNDEDSCAVVDRRDDGAELAFPKARLWPESLREQRLAPFAGRHGPVRLGPSLGRNSNETATGLRRTRDANAGPDRGDASMNVKRP